MTKVNRRKFLKKAILATSGIGVALFSYSYAFYIEPRRLEINPILVKHKKIPTSFDGFTIAQFSDTHLSSDYSLEKLQTTVYKINHLSPDLIVFSGDLIDLANKFERPEKISPILKKLQAPFGKLSIYGNHDHGGYGTELYQQIMVEANFTLLKNDLKVLTMPGGDRIQIAGLDDVMLGLPNFEVMLQRQQDLFTILLAHEPDIADQSKNYPIHLQLSGHSHGGQIALPFIGPIITPPHGQKYPKGRYELDGLTLYTNKGIGMTRIPARLFSVPEITLFTLRSI
ncbi:metallophosphoesterase [Bacillus carboniphilus]|uniref:Metallophosphoesterase n=1 Tax=Bacillus carboniphilus TaxID=86663 RepID=A0ABY9JUV9_9BACI|nr:metallophosphoesterase [Bacillus carboniphilus]WLR43192.1 metallophosphoesterase [Bacillus carboniphilus]